MLLKLFLFILDKHALLPATYCLLTTVTKSLLNENETYLQAFKTQRCREKRESDVFWKTIKNKTFEIYC